MIINKSSLTALFTGYKAIFAGAFAKYAAAPLWRRIAMLAPSETREEEYGWLGMNTRFREWIGDRQFQALKQHGYKIKNRGFENSVEVDRDDIEDDRFGIYNPLVAQMGQDAAQHPDEVVFALLAAGFANLCYDGQYFFDTDHPVGDGTVSNSGGGSGTAWYVLDTSRVVMPIIFQQRRDYEFVAQQDPNDDVVYRRKKFSYGVDCRVNAGYGPWQFAYASKQTLDETNLAAAIAAMRSFKSDAGQPLNVRPNLLVVPPSLEVAADKLVTAQYGASGASNVMAGKLEVLPTGYLS